MFSGIGARRFNAFHANIKMHGSISNLGLVPMHMLEGGGSLSVKNEFN